VLLALRLAEPALRFLALALQPAGPALRSPELALQPAGLAVRFPALVLTSSPFWKQKTLPFAYRKLVFLYSRIIGRRYLLPRVVMYYSLYPGASSSKRFNV
jgi:hypothetical protein